MTQSRIRFPVLCLLSLALIFSNRATFAQSPDEPSALKILPAPKEVHRLEGEFLVKPSTTILIGETEDRGAAELLQEEVRDRTGIKVPIARTAGAPKPAGHIVLARFSDLAQHSYLSSERVTPATDLGSQGYVLRVSSSGIIVAASTAQGVFYGVQTLRQLLHAKGKSLQAPALLVRDWPSMEWRGIQDDISRGPIPTLDYMKSQIRTLAEYKINLFALYMEHVFDYQTQPLVAPKEAALTPAEIRELVDYAQRYYITVLPEQQAFGHLHHVLKYEKYSDLAETPHGHVLTPTNPGTYDFIRQIYGEVVPLFPGPFFHIGSDETFELGQGQTKALAAQEGLGRVYIDHLQKVFAIMQPYHKELMFWGDIALKYPELLSMLPKDMIAVPWDYDPKPSYEDLITPYRNAGLRVVVAPGVNNWNQLWPDFDSAFVNIRNFVRDGQKHQAMGTLNTMWNDDGETLCGMDWPAIVFGAAASWQAGESSIDDFKNSYDWAFYRNEDRTFTNAIESLDKFHSLLKGVSLEGESDELFWTDPFTEVGAGVAAKGLPAMHEVRLSAEHAIELLLRNRGRARAHAETLDDALLAAWHLDAFGMKMQFSSEIDHFYNDAYQNQTDSGRVWSDLWEITGINARLEDLRDATTRLRGMYEQAWMRENRAYWLGNVLVRYDNLASEMQAKIVAVRQAQRQYEATKKLPPPEQLGFVWKQ